MGDVLSVVVVEEEKEEEEEIRNWHSRNAQVWEAPSLPPVSIPSLSLYIRRVAKAGQSGIPRPSVSQYASRRFVPFRDRANIYSKRPLVVEGVGIGAGYRPLLFCFCGYILTVRL